MTHILVADDDELIHLVIRILCEEEGFLVQTVGTGREAFDYLKTCEEPCVVLLDWIMPDMDGQVLLTTIAADADLRTRHAYGMITAAADCLNDDLRQVLMTLNVALLTKPFAILDLLDFVYPLRARLGAER